MIHTTKMLSSENYLKSLYFKQIDIPKIASQTLMQRLCPLMMGMYGYP
jgi:hypothetical protein